MSILYVALAGIMGVGFEPLANVLYGLTILSLILLIVVILLIYMLGKSVLSGYRGTSHLSSLARAVLAFVLGIGVMYGATEIHSIIKFPILPTIIAVVLGKRGLEELSNIMEKN